MVGTETLRKLSQLSIYKGKMLAKEENVYPVMLLERSAMPTLLWTCSDESRSVIVAACGHGSFWGTDCHAFHCVNPIWPWSVLCMLTVGTMHSCWILLLHFNAASRSLVLLWRSYLLVCLAIALLVSGILNVHNAFEYYYLWQWHVISQSENGAVCGNIKLSAWPFDMKVETCASSLYKMHQFSLKCSLWIYGWLQRNSAN